MPGDCVIHRIVPADGSCLLAWVAGDFFSGDDKLHEGARGIYAFTVPVDCSRVNRSDADPAIDRSG